MYIFLESLFRMKLKSITLDAFKSPLRNYRMNAVISFSLNVDDPKHISKV